MVKIGIPRALAYYQYFPMWHEFFNELGAEVIVSPQTTHKMVSDGGMRVVADTCLPAKVFIGHVLELKSECDYVFIPIIRSVKKRVYNCSKFLGLPDMTRAVVPDCPPILSGMVDVSKGLDKLNDEIYRIGRQLSGDNNRIKRAIKAAWNKHQEYHELMIEDSLMPEEAIAKLGYESADKNTAKRTASTAPAKTRNHNEQLTIALVGHHYLIYDDQVSHRLPQKLEKAGCRVLTPDMLTTEQMETATKEAAGRTYWTWEEEVVGAGCHYLQSGVDGVIGVAVFGCGPDSVMMDLVRRKSAANGNIPFMSLTLDEHTAEAGIVTRIEAFLDMIQRRKRRLSCA